MTSRANGSNEPWEPAKSNPGEMYTPEGQIRAVGALARGLKSSDDPRVRKYRRAMWRTGLLYVAVAVLVIVVVSIIAEAL
jgi:hypothetical protein